MQDLFAKDHVLASTVAEVKRKLELVSSRLPKPIDASILRTNGDSGVAVRTATLRAVVLARFRELTCASISCIEAEQPAAAITLVRGAIECMIMLHDLKKNLARVVQAPNLDSAAALDKFVQTALYGRRYMQDGFQAVSIMTRLDRLAKELPAIKEVYENLCEVAHPNSDGLVGLYMRYSEATDEIVFDSKNVLRYMVVAANNLSTTLDAVIVWDNEIRSIANAIDSLARGQDGEAAH